jgi:Transcriptional regulators
MNRTDKKILNYLQSNARLSNKKLSESLFITPPAVSQRVKKLEDSGYIKSYNANIDLQKLGLKIKVFIQLEVKPDQKPEFYRYIQDIPNILECDCVTGPYSMLLKAVFKTTQELDDLVSQLQHFGSTNTQVVFSTPLSSRGFEIK